MSEARTVAPAHAAQERQQAITNDMLDIAGGAEALAQASQSVGGDNG